MSHLYKFELAGVCIVCSAHRKVDVLNVLPEKALFYPCVAQSKLNEIKADPHILFFDSVDQLSATLSTLTASNKLC